MTESDKRVDETDETLLVFFDFFFLHTVLHGVLLYYEECCDVLCQFLVFAFFNDRIMVFVAFHSCTVSLEH
jgi:hypothetical protein